MGISRVASEIQIYSAVHSHSSLVETRMSLLSLSLSLSLSFSLCACACARLCILQDVDSRTLRAARGNHICSIIKLRNFYTELTVLRLTYLTFGQVAHVELEFAPRKIPDIFVDCTAVTDNSNDSSSHAV